MVRWCASVGELLKVTPVLPTTFAELRWHEGGHATIGHILGLFIDGMSVRDWRRCGGSMLVDLDDCEPLNAIDLFMAGPLGAAARRCIDSRQPITYDPLLRHFSDTACGQPDLESAVRVARTVASTRAAAIDLVDERVCEVAVLLADQPVLQHCLSTMAGVLMEFRELDGTHVHWAIRRAFDGGQIEEIVEGVHRRLGEPTLGTHVVTGLTRRQARFLR